MKDHTTGLPLVPDRNSPSYSPNADARSRALQMREEAAHRRHQELLAQGSELNSPSERIRIWERLHALDLPKSPEHRLIGVIAEQTNLQPEQVLEEQRLRLSPAVELPAA